jgi:four helix bundle protein
MDNKEFGKQLEVRTKQFAVSIIKLSVQLPNSAEGYVVKKQITKSGTSIGANYREANRSKSNADFKNKIKICEGEANETVYWLEIIEELLWVEKDRLQPLLIESNELLALFTSISHNLKNKLTLNTISTQGTLNTCFILKTL